MCPKCIYIHIDFHFIYKIIFKDTSFTQFPNPIPMTTMHNIYIQLTYVPARLWPGQSIFHRIFKINKGISKGDFR